MRLALGAGRWRIARDLAGESLVLSAAGAVAAVVLAVWMVAAFNNVISYQDLNRSEPFQVDHKVDFILQAKGESTEVTWAMQGAVPYFAKIIHLFIDMDRMVGSEFEAGLASLKTIAEKTP